MVIRQLVRRLTAVLLLVPLLSSPGLAQQQSDTTRTPAPADTVFGAARADTVSSFALDQLPVRSPFLSPVGLLQRASGSFTYYLGERGWPHGWSRFGLAPRHTQLTLNELPFANPVTGSPSYQLLPFAMVQPFDAGAVRYGQPHSINTSLRSFRAPEPLTELRYHAGHSKLQSIAAVHAQEWPLGVSAGGDSLQVLFGYVGQSTNGIYPRSATRMRRVLGRIRYWQNRWSTQLQYLYNEHNQDIHAGVMRRGSYASLFEPVGAQVTPQDARRLLARNDLVGRFRLRWHPDQAPLTLRGFWTAHEMRYRASLDTVGTQVRRLGGQVRQTLSLANHSVTVGAEIWQDRLAADNALVDNRSLLETERHLTVQDSVHWSFISAYLRGGWHSEGNVSYGSAVLGLTQNLGIFTGTVDGSLSGYAPSWVERYGFSDSVSPVLSFERSRHMRVRGLVLGDLYDWTFGLEGSFQRWEHPIVLLTRADDVRGFEQLSHPEQWLTFSGILDWRTNTKRGFRFSIKPTLFHFVSRPAAPPQQQLKGSLPAVAADATLGARYQLFQGDLDALIYLRATAWTGMRSRAFDPSTELFPLPPPDAPRWSPSGTLDLQIEAGIRQSTVFFAYENILGGVFHPGTIVVPSYPLPARFMRFGIFWPLFN